MERRYARHIMLPEIGKIGQKKLLQSRVAIVGVGGLGSPVALYLAAAGVGTIGIIDADTIALSNLQRQVLYKSSEVGESKVECASHRINELSPQTIVNTYNTRLNEENATEIISHYDIVVDCCDNAHTRYLIDEVCHRLKKPFVYGAIGAYSGQVSIFDTRHHWRYCDLYPPHDTPTSHATEQGVLGTLPGIIGCIQATEVIKIITGLGSPLIGALYTLDITTMHSSIHKIKSQQE